MKHRKKRDLRLLAALVICLVLFGGFFSASVRAQEAAEAGQDRVVEEENAAASAGADETAGESGIGEPGITEKDSAGESGTEESGVTEEGSAGEQEVLWNEDFYRAVDASGASADGLTEAQQNSLDEDCISFMETHMLDLSLIAVTPKTYEGETIEDFADRYYVDASFGYGPGGDGFQMVWDTQTDKVVIRSYGAAAGRIPASYLEFVEGAVAKYREKYGIYGPMYATMRFLSNYLNEHSDEGRKKSALEVQGASGSGRSPEEEDGAEKAGSEVEDASEKSGGNSGDEKKSRLLPDGEYPDPSLRVGEGADKPAWYPKEPSSFPFYHDESAPRVVDRADIFSEEEERQMQEGISRIRESLQRDVVVFTDVSTYGASHRDYADDFFDFNGYGYGDDFEGVCLMVCMDPDDRGWWCSCHGPVTTGLYTETVANQIDDLLYEYMVAGDYGKGVMDWIENFRRLYTTGSPYNEEWAVLGINGITRTHDADAPRVVDDAGILSAEEAALLEAKAKELSEKYGVDVAVHTACHPGILEKEEYGELYYAFRGYGFGVDYDGICLTIFKRPNYSGYCSVYASGKGKEKLSDVNRSRLENRCTDVILHRRFYEAADSWLSQAGHMLRTGRAPRSAGSWIFFTVLECIAGLIFGAVSLSRAKSNMITLTFRENANAYVVPSSISVRDISDRLINTVVNRVYDPVSTESSRSSSSSSGGRSSYSSRHTSSSGRSHSGSGRRF